MTLYNDLVPRDLTSGTLCVSGQFAYLKIPDQIVIELFNKFKKRASRQEEAVLAPFFKSNSPFPNPVGAHISIASAYECKNRPSVAEALSDLNGTVFPFECRTIEEIIPEHWKVMERAWICTVSSRALDRLKSMLLLDNDNGLSFTFAVKPRAQTEAIETISRSLPAVETVRQRSFTDSSNLNETFQSFAIKLVMHVEKEEDLLKIFEDATAEMITLKHIILAEELGYVRLANLFKGILELDDSLLFESDETATCLALESSELIVADYLKDIDPSSVKMDHIKIANKRGFFKVRDMLKRKYKLKQAEVKSMRPKVACGFAYDDLSREIVDAKDEADAIECLFEDPNDYLESDSTNLRPYHVDTAFDRGFVNLAEMFERLIEIKINQEEDDNDDFIPSDLDDIEVPLRNRKIKQDDLVSSLMRNRHDDTGVLRKVRRLSQDKFNVQHVVLARQQDLHKTGRFITKALV